MQKIYEFTWRPNTSNNNIYSIYLFDLNIFCTLRSRSHAVKSTWQGKFIFKTTQYLYHQKLATSLYVSKLPVINNPIAIIYRARKVSTYRSLNTGSKPTVGSSKISSSGSWTSAAARETRLCCPPDKDLMNRPPSGNSNSEQRKSNLLLRWGNFSPYILPK